MVIVLVIGLGVFSSACGKQASTFSTQASSITETSTTIEASATTMSDKLAETLADLVGDKTIEDVKVSSREIVKAIYPDREGYPEEIPPSLREEFIDSQTGGWLLYIGPYNRGDMDSLADNELNNCLMTYNNPRYPDAGIFYSYGCIGSGYNEPGGQGETYVHQLCMVFKGIVMIPGSNDFYLHGIDPFHDDADIYARVMRNNMSYADTYLKTYDVNIDNSFEEAFDPGSKEKSRDAGELTDEEWAIFLVPGDTLGMQTQIQVSHNQGTVLYDENEKPILKMLANIRSMGADKMNEVLGVEY